MIFAFSLCLYEHVTTLNQAGKGAASIYTACHCISSLQFNP